MAKPVSFEKQQEAIEQIKKGISLVQDEKESIIEYWIGGFGHNKRIVLEALKAAKEHAWDEETLKKDVDLIMYYIQDRDVRNDYTFILPTAIMYGYRPRYDLIDEKEDILKGYINGALMIAASKDMKDSEKEKAISEIATLNSKEPEFFIRVVDKYPQCLQYADESVLDNPDVVDDMREIIIDKNYDKIKPYIKPEIFEKVFKTASDNKPQDSSQSTGTGNGQDNSSQAKPDPTSTQQPVYQQYSPNISKEVLKDLEKIDSISAKYDNGIPLAAGEYWEMIGILKNNKNNLEFYRELIKNHPLYITNASDDIKKNEEIVEYIYQKAQEGNDKYKRTLDKVDQTVRKEIEKKHQSSNNGPQQQADNGAQQQADNGAQQQTDNGSKPTANDNPKISDDDIAKFFVDRINNNAESFTYDHHITVNPDNTFDYTPIDKTEEADLRFFEELYNKGLVTAPTDNIKYLTDGDYQIQRVKFVIDYSAVKSFVENYNGPVITNKDQLLEKIDKLMNAINKKSNTQQQTSSTQHGNSNTKDSKEKHDIRELSIEELEKYMNIYINDEKKGDNYPIEELTNNGLPVTPSIIRNYLNSIKAERSYHYPQADKLIELFTQSREASNAYQEAMANGDEDKANEFLEKMQACENEIIKILNENPIEFTDEQFDNCFNNLSIEDKKRLSNLKLIEAIYTNNREAFNKYCDLLNKCKVAKDAKDAGMAPIQVNMPNMGAGPQPQQPAPAPQPTPTPQNPPQPTRGQRVAAGAKKVGKFLLTKALPTTLGVVAGGVLSCIPGTGIIGVPLVVIKTAKATNKIIHVIANKKGGTIRHIANINDRLSSSFVTSAKKHISVENQERIRKVRDTLRKDPVRLFLNGAAIGYVAGNVYKMINHETIIDSIRGGKQTPDVSQITTNDTPEVQDPQMDNQAPQMDTSTNTDTNSNPYNRIKDVKIDGNNDFGTRNTGVNTNGSTDFGTRNSGVDITDSNDFGTRNSGVNINGSAPGSSQPTVKITGSTDFGTRNAGGTFEGIDMNNSVNINGDMNFNIRNNGVNIDGVEEIIQQGGRGRH